MLNRQKYVTKGYFRSKKVKSQVGSLSWLIQGQSRKLWNLNFSLNKPKKNYEKKFSTGKIMYWLVTLCQKIYLTGMFSYLANFRPTEETPKSHFLPEQTKKYIKYEMHRRQNYLQIGHFDPPKSQCNQCS